MAIHVSHREPVRASAAQAFALIDDLPRTAEWLPPCVSLTKREPGPNAVGHTLRYVYRQGGRQGEMGGTIVAYEPGRRLHCVYQDAMFEVSVDLGVETTTDGTITTHDVRMTPRTVFGRLMAPLIRGSARRQTETAAANLRRLLDG